jgi:hypothetical protein
MIKSRNLMSRHKWAVFILWQSLVSSVSNRQIVYFAWEYQWGHWSSKEMVNWGQLCEVIGAPRKWWIEGNCVRSLELQGSGELRAIVCCGEQLLWCLISYFSLYNFQREGSNGIGVSINHLCCCVRNELPYSCLVGFWKEIKSDLIPWSPMSLCCILK